MNNPNIVEKNLSYKLMGILFKVHNKLGGEYQEKYYQRAVTHALKREKISFKEQLDIDLEFEKEKIGKYFLDFLIEGKIVLEIKAVPRLKPMYFRQVRAYLKAKNLELGILANFHGQKLTYKRILCPIRIKNSDNLHSDVFVLLARQTIEHYLITGKVMEVPKNLPKELTTKRAGTFVSIHTKSGDLRGCIGTFLPTMPSVAHEIIKNALSASLDDPRFPPVKLEELPNLKFSVDVLSKPKLVPSTYPLNPKKYGLIVSTSGGRRGLLLPDIPSVNTSEEQIRICKMKAGIGLNEPVNFEIFTVNRHPKNSD
jgi:AmmeMemoRadiSam system protein A